MNANDNNENFKPVEFDGFRKQAGMEQPKRLAKLNRIAIEQMKLLTDDNRE